MSLLGITALNWVLALAGIVAALTGAWLKIRPSVRRGSAVADAILGEKEVLDRGGKVITSAQPGLVHRVGMVEEAVVEFRHVVGLLTETQKRIDTVEHRVRELEKAAVERMLTKAESAAMWQAVANKDTLDAESDDEDAPAGELPES